MAETAPSEVVAHEVFFAAFIGDSRGLGWALRRIAGELEDVHFEPGGVVYRQGDASDYHYFVVSGEVRLRKPGASDWVFGPRSLVGIMDVTLGRPRSRTAVATVPTHILRLPGARWWSLMEDSFEFTRRGVKYVAAGVHELRLRPPPLGGFDDPPSTPFAGTGPLHLVDRVLLLRQVPLLARAGVQSLATLAQLADEVHLAKGGLFPGGIDGRLLIVASGEVMATRDDPPSRGRFGHASLVCGSAALADASSYEVRALDETRVIAVAREDYFDVMEEHFGLARSALIALTEEREGLLDRAPEAVSLAP